MLRRFWIVVCIGFCLAAVRESGAQNVQAEELQIRAADGEQKYANYTYKEIQNGTGTVRITRYSGNEMDVVIPDKIDNKKVVTISDGAFRYCGAYSITVPEGVTKIDDYAFSECPRLVSVILPDGLETIDTGAFWCCPNLVDIHLPSSVKSIGGRIFGECATLADLSIPDGITEISGSMFENCKSLLDVDIPFSVKKIGNMAFAGRFRQS